MNHVIQYLISNIWSTCFFNVVILSLCSYLSQYVLVALYICHFLNIFYIYRATLVIFKKYWLLPITIHNLKWYYLLNVCTVDYFIHYVQMVGDSRQLSCIKEAKDLYKLSVLSTVLSTTVFCKFQDLKI